MTAILDAQHAFGYHFVEDFEGEFQKDPYLVNSIYLIDISNFASIFLSPLVGIARIIYSLYLLHQVNNDVFNDEEIDIEAFKRFLKMSVMRGVLELFCLGPLLGTIVDTGMTLKHSEAIIHPIL